MTTPAGEAVSGAKPARFTRESVEQALAALRDRIQANNKERQAAFRITDAVAFGDFLLPDRARVQSADVGINLVRSESRSPSRSGHLKMNKSTSHSTSAPRSEPRSATEAKAERSFLRDLRAKSAHLTLRPYAGWMRQRTHQDLL
jgi:endonuclease/exonuclease/phosphatase family metal-dependent hydrolase